jgi:hypothetical protein
MVGAMELTDTIRVDGMRRSVYFATSMDAPMESRVFLSREMKISISFR